MAQAGTSGNDLLHQAYDQVKYAVGLGGNTSDDEAPEQDSQEDTTKGGGDDDDAEEPNGRPPVGPGVHPDDPDATINTGGPAREAQPRTDQGDGDEEKKSDGDQHKSKAKTVGGVNVAQAEQEVAGSSSDPRETMIDNALGENGPTAHRKGATTNNPDPVLDSQNDSKSSSKAKQKLKDAIKERNESAGKDMGPAAASASLGVESPDEDKKKEKAPAAEFEEHPANRGPMWASR
jgi:hypothetical protein